MKMGIPNNQGTKLVALQMGCSNADSIKRKVITKLHIQASSSLH
jgi:hypothetical protein